MQLSPIVSIRSQPRGTAHASVGTGGPRHSVGSIEGLPIVKRASPPTPASRMAAMAWRHRRELLPVWTGLALLVAAATAHVYAPGAWPAAVPLGAAGTALLRKRADQG